MKESRQVTLDMYCASCDNEYPMSLILSGDIGRAIREHYRNYNGHACPKCRVISTSINSDEDQSLIDVDVEHTAQALESIAAIDGKHSKAKWLRQAIESLPLTPVSETGLFNLGFEIDSLVDVGDNCESASERRTGGERRLLSFSSELALPSGKRIRLLLIDNNNSVTWSA
jgi:hypothetical protein